MLVFVHVSSCMPCMCTRVALYMHVHVQCTHCIYMYMYLENQFKPASLVATCTIRLQRRGLWKHIHVHACTHCTCIYTDLIYLPKRHLTITCIYGMLVKCLQNTYPAHTFRLFSYVIASAATCTRVYTCTLH